MMETTHEFGALRPELFAASRGVDAASKGIAPLGRMVGDLFAIQLSDWSGVAMTLPVATVNHELPALLKSLATGGLAAVAENADGGEQVFVAIDQSAVQYLINQFFGSDGAFTGTGAAHQATKIEHALTGAILESLIRAIERALTGSAVFQFRFTGLIDEIEAVVFDEPVSPVGFKIPDDLDAGGIYFALPRSVVERFNATQLAAEEAGRTAPDLKWQALMQERLRAADITVEAVLDGPNLPLARLIGLRAGQLISLNVGLDALVRIEHRGVPIYYARLGQTDGTLSLCIDSVIAAV